MVHRLSIAPPTSVTWVQLWPRIVCGLSFSRSQSDSEGFSPGTPVFLPHQNGLSVDYIRLRAGTLDRDPSLDSILVGDYRVHPSNTARNIGVVFDQTLSLDMHVNLICKSALFHLRNIVKVIITWLLPTIVNS